MLKKRINLFGLFIDDVSIECALQLAWKGLESEGQTSFFTPNFEFLASARKSEHIRELINSASLNLPDGFGLRIVSSLLGTPIKNTVAGIDFGERLIGLAEKEGRGIFLLGSKVGVAEKASANLRKSYPHLKISGVYHGFFSSDEIDSLCKKINASGAEILIVCRGFPLQERFVVEACEKLPSVKVFACLGGSMDVWAGECRRAPLILRRLHLEWLWRIINEPQRMRRFISSLSVLWEALYIRFTNLMRLGIKCKKGAYNQVND